MRSILLWMLGVPIPIIILIALFSHWGIGLDLQPERAKNDVCKTSEDQKQTGLTERMTMATPEAFATRQTRVDSWRLRLDETRARYQKATEWYRRLVQEQPDATPYDPTAPWHSLGKRSHKPLPNIPYFTGFHRVNCERQGSRRAVRGGFG